MSETSPTEPSAGAHSADPTTEAGAAEPAAAPSPEPTATTHSAAPPASKLSRWATLAALIIAVIAVAAAALGWFFPHKSASAAPTYSDQQTKDAKKTSCETFVLVDRAVVRNSRLKNPENGGPIGALSVATTARLAFYGGGAFLKDRVSQQPATPPDLTKALNAISGTLEELSIGYMAGAPEFAQDQLRQNLDGNIKTVADICKK
jgi:hypothetical protein